VRQKQSPFEQVSANLILRDDRMARQEAADLRLNFIGLLEAKRTGLLQEIRPVMDDLISRAGFWVGASLYTSVLSAAGD
jgi:predicted nucleic acid-binding protein